MPRYLTSHQRAASKERRANMTPAEKLLWSQLRAHRFMGLSIRRHAPVGPYVVPFLIPSQRLIIEIEERIAHAEDSLRQGLFESLGYRNLRLRERDVLGNLGAVLGRLSAYIH